jgi:hypothetical protein
MALIAYFSPFHLDFNRVLTGQKMMVTKVKIRSTFLLFQGTISILPLHYSDTPDNLTFIYQHPSL